MFAEIPVEQLSAALDDVVSGLLAEAGIVAPPIDAFDVAERLGVVVAREGGSPTRARMVRLAALAPTIFLAEDSRPERRHWAIAHEIGESRVHAAFFLLGVDPRDAPASSREAVANRLAGRILLPGEWFAADGAAANWDLLELKSLYGTASHELISRRMLEMATPVIITLWDHGRPRWRATNVGGRTPLLTAPERDAQRAAHTCGRLAHCECSELPSGIADVRAWPVHEPGWKREIVRTALTEAW